jgi:hypothetical protein
MRGLALFIAGTLVGLAATSVAQNQTPNRGIVGLNHVALSVPDLDNAVEYYTKTMIAVGTVIADRPPHKAVRAQFGHTASTLGV